MQAEVCAFPFKCADLLRNLLQRLIIGFLNRQIQKNFVFFQFLFKFFKAVNFIGQGGALLQNRFRILGNVPETFLRDGSFDFCQSTLLVVQVKDSLADFRIGIEALLIFV